MIDQWERNVPVYDVPIWTRPFIGLCGLGGLAILFVSYRELAGLGPASGMNDAYAWGIWKTFNTMTLTGLGSEPSRSASQHGYSRKRICMS